jgi:hypothetical protein
MRTSIRDPNNTKPKIIVVPDAGTSEYLEKLLPGCQVEKLKTKISELKSSKRHGRPRQYDSPKERQASYRKRQKTKHLRKALGLQESPYLSEESCAPGNRPIIGDEKGIDVITHFITHDGHDGLCGTFYRDKESGNPCGYLYCANTERFIHSLEYFHSRKAPNKEANLLFSPAIFDPNHPKRVDKQKRGLNNIVAMQHLWMDFENGDLSPDELPQLFPHIRLVVFNTYNHTEEAPRFRVVIPLTRSLSPENYELLYDNIIAKIEDSGYSVGSKGTRRSGLDVGKKSAVSLFYLPCQARDSSQSFF